MNYNLLIAGKSGAGKSFLSKIIINRFLQKHPQAVLFIIDPEGEYTQLGKILNCKTVEVDREKGLGLDPIVLFGTSKDSAANILGDLANISDPVLRSELRTVVGSSKSLPDAYRQSSKQLKAYLRSLVEGSDSFLIKGEPLEFSQKMTFDLHALHREFTLAKQGTMTLQAASVLLFSKIWQLLEDPKFVPTHIPKLVVVDEVWLYTSMPAAAAFLEGVARRGRKRNVFFVLNTQRVADVLESSGGRALIENCASKVLLRQDEAAIKLAIEITDLSNSEKEALLDFSPGQGLLIAESVHIPVNFLATKDEYNIFTTKPGEKVDEQKEGEE
jgi:type IV secretory pathway VirB4 component